MDLQMKEPNQVTLKDGNHGQMASLRCEEEVKSLLTIKNEVSPEDSQDEVSKKETVKQMDLQMKEPKQITLKDGSHGQKASLRCKEEVKSLLTIKKEVSPKDSQDEVSKEETEKEESISGDIPEDSTLKDRRTEKKDSRCYKEEAGTILSSDLQNPGKMAGRYEKK